MLDRFAKEDGSISEDSIRYYNERGRGGAGMLIVGAVYFTPESHYRPNQTGLWDDSLIESHRTLTDTVHRTGALISCQLQHGGIRLAQKAFGAGRASRPVGPSAIPFATTDAIPHALTPEEIHELTEAFAVAARRVREAGYDVVDVHAGHGYILHSFLSPFYNKREDLYGGPIENRARFTCEVIRRIKEVAGEDFPINVRINGSDFLPGGIDIEQATVHARLIEEAGADAVHVSAGTRESRQYMIPGSFFPQAIYADLAAKVKGVIKIPVMSVGRHIDPLLAEEVLAKRKADFILMGRGLLADPEWPNKAREGRISEIRRCIGDNVGCAARDIKKFPRISCTVNAAVGHEEKYRIQPAAIKKKVMVVGGGPAGMEAARVASLRGHRVSLYERTKNLGGQLNVAAIPPHNREIQNLTEFLVSQIKASGVEIHTDVHVTPELVLQEKPDAVVLAIGAQPIRPDTPGVDGDNVVLAADVLTGNARVGKRVVVVGGGLVGMETSLVLSQSGKRVALVEMLPKVGMNANSLEMLCMMERLLEQGVQILTNTRLLSIHPGGVTVVMKQLTSENELISIQTDTVVIAMGYRPADDLAKRLEAAGCTPLVIGDCKEPRKIIDAIHEGFRLGLSL
jgi:2,4-dienoyl-CoA reductase-like NADH-dependent reductase (Old Yellow Enzyme family)/thioredoxin reductase